VTGPEDAGAGAGRALAYHEATKHSWQSVRGGHHVLDWANKPLPFKIYPDLPALTLPREVAAPAMPALDALAGPRGGAAVGRGRLDADGLAQLLFFSGGLTKKKVYPGGESVHFRAAASTGALYEIEIYLLASTVPGLDAGVYHFCPGDFALRRLRPGDHRAALASATGDAEAVRAAPATLVLSAVYWRNTWKYQARAFRHFFWDAGTLLANLLATAVARELPARVLIGFVDDAVNALCGLDAAREGAVALVALGGDAPAPPSPPPAPPLSLTTVPLSEDEVDYPLVRAAYAASSLPDAAAARAWTGPLDTPRGGPAAGRSIVPAAPPPDLPLGATILRRGSTRQFDRVPIAFEALSSILDAAVRPLPLDAGSLDRPVVDCYLAVHAVGGLAAGSYAYDPASRRLTELRTGDFREESGYLCLEQALGADASVVVFFLTDLAPILARYGDRGYRLANLEAGLLGGRMYLAAYAQGLGASGLTFFDDDVVRFFSPHAAGKEALFVTALGRARRATSPRAGLLAEGELHALAPGQS
jgi:SagB-type dehydrogenase family enzyme